jgi:hypothetical protein
VVEWGFDAVC